MLTQAYTAFIMPQAIKKWTLVTAEDGAEVKETSNLIEHCLNFNPSFSSTVHLILRRDADLSKFSQQDTTFDG